MLTSESTNTYIGKWRHFDFVMGGAMAAIGAFG